MDRFEDDNVDVVGDSSSSVIQNNSGRERKAQIRAQFLRQQQQQLDTADWQSDDDDYVDWSITKMKIVKFSHVWTVTSFGLRPEKTGEKVASCEFAPYDDENEKGDDKEWCLELYPKGVNEENKEYVSVFLKLLDADGQEVSAKYKISILNAEGEEIIVRKSQGAWKFNKHCNFSGFRKFVRRDFLMDEAYGLLPGDRLTVYCEVNIFDESRTSGTLLPVAEVPERRVAEDAGQSFGRFLCSDVILLHAGGREFKVHKDLLVARSTVFAAMFAHELEETKQSRVEISDVDEDVMVGMLQYIYTGRAPDVDKMAFRLLPVADKYDLSNLKLLCEDALRKDLTVENVVSNLSLAYLHGAQNLRKDCTRFIISHAADVMESEEWASLVCSQPRLVSEVLRILAGHCRTYLPPPPPKKRAKV